MEATMLETIFTAFLGAFLFKLLDLGFNRYENSSERKRQQADKVRAYLDEYADLAQLFHFIAVQNTRVVRDERGELLTDDEGNYVVERETFVPPEYVQKAIEALSGATIYDEIDRRKVAIELQTTRVDDLIKEMGLEQQLHQKFIDLWWNMMRVTESVIKTKNWEGMEETLTEVHRIRREIRDSLNKYVQITPFSLRL
jgi:endonuclease III-like uncharacterized protein